MPTFQVDLCMTFLMTLSTHTLADFAFWTSTVLKDVLKVLGFMWNDYVLEC